MPGKERVKANHILEDFLRKKILLASFYTDEHSGVILVMYMRYCPVIWKLNF